jgi:hypothetical protein
MYLDNMSIKEKLKQTENYLNRSRTYLIPLLNQYVDINKALLFNSYLFDINNPEINIPNVKGVLVLFERSSDPAHIAYTQKLVNHNLTEKYYEVTDELFMVYIKIPLEIAKDIKLLLDGKYSQISDTSKQTILKYWSLGSSSQLYHILKKSPNYKKELESILDTKLDDDAELGSLFDLHKETFKEVIKTVELK